MLIPGNKVESLSVCDLSRGSENDEQQAIGIPQEFDKSGSNLVLECLGLAEHDLWNRKEIPVSDPGGEG